MRPPAEPSATDTVSRRWCSCAPMLAARRTRSSKVAIGGDRRRGAAYPPRRPGGAVLARPPGRRGTMTESHTSGVFASAVPEDELSRLARRLRDHLEPLASNVYFAPEVHAGFQEIGFGP